MIKYIGAKRRKALGYTQSELAKNVMYQQILYLPLNVDSTYHL